jgi:CelD/BcsL family acetyltransferase involved in cellulose biosynthesis
MMPSTDIAEYPAPATAAPEEVTGAWIVSTDDFEPLGPEWRELWAKGGHENAFLSFDWMFTWWRHFGRRHELAAIVLRAGTRVVGIAPFHIKRQFRAARCLAFLASTHVGSDHLDVLAAPGWEADVVAKLASMLLAHPRGWDYIEFGEVGKESVAASLCVRLAAEGMPCEEALSSICPYTLLPASFEEYLAGASANLRSNYRRRSRQIQDAGRVDFRMLSEPAAMEGGFSELMRLHGLRFQQLGEDSAFLKAAVPEFHREALQALAAQGLARVFLLQVNGESVAALYGFSAGRTFQFYQSGMHPEWTKYGVGLVTMGNTIREAITSGHTTFDFLRGSEEYKSKWARLERRDFALRVFSHSPAGMAVRIGLRAAKTIRRAAKALKTR